jgi:hypothetical protein
MESVLIRVSLEPTLQNAGDCLPRIKRRQARRVRAAGLDGVVNLFAGRLGTADAGEDTCQGSAKASVRWHSVRDAIDSGQSGGRRVVSSAWVLQMMTGR